MQYQEPINQPAQTTCDDPRRVEHFDYAAAIRLGRREQSRELARLVALLGSRLAGTKARLAASVERWMCEHLRRRAN